MKKTSPLWRVTLSDLDYGPEEERAVIEVLRSKWLSMGDRTAEFESSFAEYVGAEHAVAVGNCTAALHLALLSAGVGPGHEVIVPSLTFVATVNAVIYCGAIPVFADIVGPESLLIDPESVASKLTERTRAVLPMHYGGYVCNLDALAEIADRHGLSIVNDAAHAVGSTWKGRPIGGLGNASCYSFFSNKNLVTGEGGMVTTGDAGLADAVRLNRSHGMTAASIDKQKGHAFTYDVVNAGFNYRLTEIESALGLAQLRKLTRNNEIRRRRVADYRARLAAIDGVSAPFSGRDEDSACHIMVVLLPVGVDRARVQAAMKEQGIQTSVHYPPVHRFSRFSGEFAADVPRVDAVAPRLLTLPLHPLMSTEDVGIVCDALESSL